MSDVGKRLKRIERLLQELVDQGQPQSTTLHVSNIDEAFRRHQVERQQDALKFNPRDVQPDLSEFHEKIREGLEAQKETPALHLDLSEAAKQLNEFRAERVAAEDNLRGATEAVRDATASLMAARSEARYALEELRLEMNYTEDGDGDDGTAGVPA